MKIRTSWEGVVHRGSGIMPAPKLTIELLYFSCLRDFRDIIEKRLCREHIASCTAKLVGKTVPDVSNP